jgi:AAA family ATP:ADP antiporter
MLLFAALLFVVAALPLAALRIPERAEDADGVAAQPQHSMVASARVAWQNAFARRVFAVTLVAVVTVTLVDFLFKSRIAAEYKDAAELGAYISSFYAVTNALAVFAQLVLAPWIFRTIGVQRALFFSPVALLGGAAFVLATGGAFVAAVVMRGFDNVLRYSIHKTSMELLLVAVPDGTRERVKPIIDLLASRGGQALASIAILVLVALGAGGPVVVGAVVLTLAVIWTALVVTIRSLYLDVFRETLKSGGLSGKAELPELDLAVLETLFAGLNSSRDTEVLASLELLADQKRERLIPALILYHPSRDVVLRALELFAAQGRADFAPIADRLDSHPDRDVAAAALRARAAVAPDRKLLEQRLSGACSQVSAASLVALMSRGWISAEAADDRIEAILASRYWGTAAELARAIRDVARTRSDDGALEDKLDALLVRLANEAEAFAGEASPALDRPARPGGFIPELPLDARVKLEVARAMATRKHACSLPVLVEMLDRHELRAAARAALSEIPGAYEHLVEALARGELRREVRVHLPRTIAMFTPHDAAKSLLPLLATDKDGAVRFKILRALVRLRRVDPTLVLDESILLSVTDTTLAHAMDLRRWGAALVDGDEPATSLAEPDPLRAAHRLLVDLVRDKETHSIQRLFMLLELLDGEDFDDVVRGLRSKNPKTRASSVELVENLVRPPLRARVLALVGDGAIAGAIPSYEDTLREMLARGGTMRVLAEYRAIEIGIDLPGVAGRRASQPPTAETIGKRLLDKARDLLREPLSEGGTRAPA